MKATKQCPKCQSRRVGCFESQPDFDGRSEKARAIGLARETSTGMLGTRRREAYVGELEAYVCIDCGYYESYVKQPGKVPWERLLGFRILNDPRLY